ncbi:unnamed protein product [Leptidea sinapis]|uniref:Uncharacterized protein n=1 Tax=Leptidea sinapis TaxID=189913 RepID=A0A5E4QIS2_9NEOP|nr:unnamed protein product [Leptidea sinapis]
MGTQKPGEWANTLISRFEEQLPYKTGAQSLHSRINEEQCKACLVQISRHRFSLVISGLTKILQRVNEMPTLTSCIPRPLTEIEKGYHDTLVIVLDTLEICLSSQPKDTAKYDEAMNVKILLKEVCQFIDENPDYTDIELIQYINIDVLRLIRLFTGQLLRKQEISRRHVAATNHATYIKPHLELVTDCFVSLFRIMPHTNDALKVCLNLNSNTFYHTVIGYISHTTLRLLSLKTKESKIEEIPVYRTLLLYLVRLIHADPMLMLSFPSGVQHQSKAYPATDWQLSRGVTLAKRRPHM